SSSAARGRLPRFPTRRSSDLLAGAALAVAPAQGQAQTTLKWAHVYETSEPYHSWAVWAGEELSKRTDGRYSIEVFPASSLGKERSEEHTSELQSRENLVCRLL